MTESTDQIPLSGLNHYAYCPRRCGLIHVEGELTDNIHTARGTAEHERVEYRYGACKKWLNDDHQSTGCLISRRRRADWIT